MIVITIGRKPLTGSVADNILVWLTGGLNIDVSRIKHVNQADIEESVNKNRHRDFNSNNGIRVPTKGIYGGDFRPPANYEIKSGGRWPANVILEHKFDCVCLGNKQIKGHKGYPNGPGGVWSKEYLETKSTHGRTWNDPSFKVENKPWDNPISKDGLETISVWWCVQECPVKILDDQSGECKGWRSQNHNTFNPYAGQSFHNSQTNRVGYYEGYDDIGGASRFFKQMKEDT
jgi:hypothetical protein